MVSHLDVTKFTGGYPITTDQAKAWLIDILEEEDEIIEDLIAAAADDIERATKLILRKGEAVIYATCWPSKLYLEHRPVHGVKSITYKVPGIEEAQTLADTNYKLYTDGMLTTIIISDDVQAVEIDETDPRPITITFNVGYDVDAADDAADGAGQAPAWVRRMMRGLTALHYEYRNTPPDKMIEAVDKYLRRFAPPAI